MGRAKFSLTDHLDQKNFMAYVERNEENLFYDLKSFAREQGKDTLEVVNEFKTMLEYLRSPGFILDTSMDERYVFYDRLLYMLPAQTIERVKVSLRARRNRSPSKKQVTLNDDAHSLLKAFATEKGLSLSDAVEMLCYLQRQYDKCLDDLREIYEITQESGDIKAGIGKLKGSDACFYRMGSISSIAERGLTRDKTF